MIVGILSDSHGHVEPVRHAVQLFDRLGAEALFHCGDVGGQPVFDVLAGRTVWFVWGNTDWPEPGIERYLEAVGIRGGPGPLRIDLDSRTIVLCHGHERQFRALLRRPDCDYLFCGHTHRRADRRIGRCRLVNPGALHRASPRTVATLDLRTDNLAFHEI